MSNYLPGHCWFFHTADSEVAHHHLGTANKELAGNVYSVNTYKKANNVIW